MFNVHYASTQFQAVTRTSNRHVTVFKTVTQPNMYRWSLTGTVPDEGRPEIKDTTFAVSDECLPPAV